MFWGINDSSVASFTCKPFTADRHTHTRALLLKHRLKLRNDYTLTIKNKYKLSEISISLQIASEIKKYKQKTNENLGSRDKAIRSF